MDRRRWHLERAGTALISGMLGVVIGIAGSTYTRETVNAGTNDPSMKSIAGGENPVGRRLEVTFPHSSITSEFRIIWENFPDDRRLTLVYDGVLHAFDVHESTRNQVHYFWHNINLDQYVDSVTLESSTYSGEIINVKIFLGGMEFEYVLPTSGGLSTIGYIESLDLEESHHPDTNTVSMIDIMLRNETYIFLLINVIRAVALAEVTPDP